MVMPSTCCCVQRKNKNRSDDLWQVLYSVWFLSAHNRIHSASDRDASLFKKMLCILSLSQQIYMLVLAAPTVCTISFHQCRIRLVFNGGCQGLRVYFGTEGEREDVIGCQEAADSLAAHSSQHPSRPELSTEPPVTFLTLSQPRQELCVIKLKFGATAVVQLHTERMEYSTVI